MHFLPGGRTRKARKILYEDEHCVVFQDINPKAPVHLLVIPRKHITSLNENSGERKGPVGPHADRRGTHGKGAGD